MRRALATAVLALAWSAAAGARGADFDCDVDATIADPSAIVVDLAYRCPGEGIELSTDSGATARHVVEVRDGAGKEIAADGFYWRVPGDRAHVRIALGDLARRTDNVTTALRRGDAVLAILPAWMLQPAVKGVAPQALRIGVSLPEGWRFSSGLPRDASGRWLLSGTPVRFAGYAALGRFDSLSVAVPTLGPVGSTSLDVAFFDGDEPLPRTVVAGWVGREAEAQARLWGGFSDRPFLVAVVGVPGPRVRFGRVVPGGGPSVMLQVGTGVDRAALYEDWVLPHELVHTRMPFIRGRGAWLMEGAATYWEPIVRARAGWRSEADVWKEWIEHMPRGLAAFRTAGLNDAQGQANYWGGALFHLLADMDIRRATGGARGLEDCYRAILHAGGDASKRWSVPEFAAACDRGSETDTMRRFVERFVFSPEAVDLNAVWQQLGVSMVDGEVRFDDAAPSADVRKLLVLGPVEARRPPIPAD